MPTLSEKALWRRRLLASRQRLSPTQLAQAATALASHLAGRLVGLQRVAAYLPVNGEPGSVGLLDELRASGTIVLLPVVRPGRQLGWVEYEGPAALAPASFGLVEPTGPLLGPAPLAQVDAVLAPALAVDHAGTRLGRGAGYYDRALRAVSAETPVAALLHDGELLPRLPADPWDRPVTAAVTPAAGWTDLPLVAHHVS